ncbi:MAG: hypothetical protein KAU99_03010, partial [Thermoplasmata archaeon]|nr:hypothetical protein [Thermoplasmata archaeon]
DTSAGEEAVDLRDLAPEVQRIGLGLIRAHPIYEKKESSGVQTYEATESVRDLSSVEILPMCLSDVPQSGREPDSRFLRNP